MNHGNQGWSALSLPNMLAAKVGSALSIRRVGNWLVADADTPWPRTGREWLLVPFYVLVALTALQLIPSPDFAHAAPSWLLLVAMVVGALGVLYPSRNLAVGAVCAFWLAAGTVVALQPPGYWIIYLPIVVVGGLFVVLSTWVDKGRMPFMRRRRDAQHFDDYLGRMAAFLPGPLAALRSNPPKTLPETAGTTTLTGQRSVEVSRHFDSALEASINGGFHQWMKNRSLGLGVGIGRFSLGASAGHGWGAGTIELAARGTIREDMVNDSFTAVLERDGSDSPDVTRLVVPAAIALQDYVRQLVWDWQRRLTINSQAELAVRIHLDGLADALVCDTSYVGDRLSSFARLGRGAPATVSVVGAPIGEHAVLAGAVQFTPDGEWYQLFPIALINAIVDLMNGRLPTPPAPPTLPTSGRGSPMEPPSHNGEFHETSKEAAPATLGTESHLKVSTIGRFSISLDGADLTGALSQKPVASFLWLYMLMRALRNPKEALSRAALADEAFPNLDSKQQRTRLRQRLSDMQATLPHGVADCLRLEGDRVRFDLETSQVDAVALRRWAATIATLRGPMDDAELSEAAVLVDGLADGAFLPGWEALEAKVTGAKGSASAVVDDVRSDVDRWRAAVLIGIADAYVARNRSALAVRYLERVVQQHPDNELATRKLVAAYLDSGQPAKAAELDAAVAKPRR
jgi:DNA-binding SARP family transcriptional activator